MITTEVKNLYRENMTDEMSHIEEFNVTENDGANFCGIPPNLEERETHRMLDWWAGGIVVTTIGSIGLIGNIVSLVAIIFLPSKRKTMFYKLLLTLAIFDIIFIISGGLLMIQVAFRFTSEWFKILFPILTYPAAGFGMTGSTYTCIAISIERYLGICHPNVGRRFRRLEYYLICVGVSCLLIDMPRFFEVERRVSRVDNSTSTLVYTELRKDHLYIQAYMVWYRLITTFALPFVVLSYCNVRIFCYYRQNCFERTTLRSSAGHRACVRTATAPAISFQSSCQVPMRRALMRRESQIIGLAPHQERGLFIILLWVSVTFLICHTPRAILNIYEFHCDYMKKSCLENGKPFYYPKWTVYVRCIEKICLIVNSSANFAFYSLFGKDLRNHMKKCVMIMFGKKKRIKFNSMNKSSVSTRASRLPEKNDNIRLQLPKKDILYDIDENEENEMSPEEDCKTPSRTFPQCGAREDGLLNKSNCNEEQDDLQVVKNGVTASMKLSDVNIVDESIRTKNIFEGQNDLVTVSGESKLDEEEMRDLSSLCHDILSNGSNNDLHCCSAHSSKAANSRNADYTSLNYHSIKRSRSFEFRKPTFDLNLNKKIQQTNNVLILRGDSLIAYDRRDILALNEYVGSTEYLI